MNKNNEQWAVIEDYEAYEVSSFGNVRRADNKKELSKIRMNTGYYCVHIGGKMVLLHRLVAKAFCINGQNYTKINHIDEDKSNNTAWNLEWCDTRWNNNWGTRTERAKNRVYRAVECYSLDGKLLNTYKNASEAVRSVHSDVNSSLILLTCKGKRNSAYGYKWRYTL